MQTYIAFFRGINVGGKNALPMKELVGLFESLGASAVTTLIQSGNVVFRTAPENAARLSERLGEAIKKRFGFEPHVVVLAAVRLEEALRSNPFPEAEPEPTTLLLGFLKGTPPCPNLPKLELIKKPSERFHLANDVFYLHAPEGIGRSKLMASCERLLGVPMTMRNWNTVCRARDIAVKLGG